MAQLVVSLVFAALGSLLLVVAGRLFFGLHLPLATAPVLVAFLVSAAGIFALGFVLASVLPNARTAQAVGMTVLFPMMFLSGAALPRPMLSATIQNVAQVLPLTHVVSLIDDAWTGAGWNWPAMAILGGVLVVGFAISVRAFRWE